MPIYNKKKDLRDRLARISGHLKKVQAMVEENVYCIDIITQSLAIQNALHSVDEVILRNHLQTCVKDAIISDKDVDQKIDEVIKTMNFMRK